MRLSVGSAQAKGLGQRSAPPLARAAAPVEWPCQEPPRARESTGRHGRTLKHWGDRRALVLTASSTNQIFKGRPLSSPQPKGQSPEQGRAPTAVASHRPPSSLRPQQQDYGISLWTPLNQAPEKWMCASIARNSFFPLYGCSSISPSWQKNRHDTKQNPLYLLKLCRLCIYFTKKKLS